MFRKFIYLDNLELGLKISDDMFLVQGLSIPGADIPFCFCEIKDLIEENGLDFPYPIRIVIERGIEDYSDFIAQINIEKDEGSPNLLMWVADSLKYILYLVYVLARKMKIYHLEQ